MPPAPIEINIAGQDMVGLALRKGVSFTIKGIHCSYSADSISVDTPVAKGVSAGATYGQVAQSALGPTSDERLTLRIIVHF